MSGFERSAPVAGSQGPRRSEMVRFNKAPPPATPWRLEVLKAKKAAEDAIRKAQGGKNKSRSHSRRRASRSRSRRRDRDRDRRKAGREREEKPSHGPTKQVADKPAAEKGAMLRHLATQRGDVAQGWYAAMARASESWDTPSNGHRKKIPHEEDKRMLLQSKQQLQQQQQLQAMQLAVLSGGPMQALGSVVPAPAAVSTPLLGTASAPMLGAATAPLLSGAGAPLLSSAGARAAASFMSGLQNQDIEAAEEARLAAAQAAVQAAQTAVAAQQAAAQVAARKAAEREEEERRRQKTRREEEEGDRERDRDRQKKEKKDKKQEKPADTAERRRREEREQKERAEMERQRQDEIEAIERRNAERKAKAEEERRQKTKQDQERKQKLKGAFAMDDDDDDEATREKHMAKVTGSKLQINVSSFSRVAEEPAGVAPAKSKIGSTDEELGKKLGFEDVMDPADAFIRLQERKRKGRRAEFGGPPRGCSPWRDGKKGVVTPLAKHRDIR